MSHPSYHETGPEGIDLIRWPHRTHSLPEADVIVFFTSRGIAPLRWESDADTIHPPHTHDYKKVLFCIEGEITFSFPDLKTDYTLYAGDRLLIPMGLRHSALVSPQGVTCIEGKGG